MTCRTSAFVFAYAKSKVSFEALHINQILTIFGSKYRHSSFCKICAFVFMTCLICSGSLLFLSNCLADNDIGVYEIVQKVPKCNGTFTR